MYYFYIKFNIIAYNIKYIKENLKNYTSYLENLINKIS